MIQKLENINELIELLTLEQLDVNLYRGHNLETPWGRVFGGQVLGQALSAAYRTVPEDRYAHSLHGYFILSGDISHPIIYEVDTIRDGGSFTTRRVTAKQYGKPIFVMATSFQLKQDGFDHQNEMPQVTQPEDLLTDMQQAELIKKSSPGLYKKMLGRYQGALDFKPVDKLSFDEIDNGTGLRNVWMKSSETIDIALPLQHQILAFASDYDLLISAIYPHRTKFDMNKLFLASLDHAMWFHRDFNFNDWLLFSINSPSASNSRGMGYGSIFDRNGGLVATVIQEGLMRIMKSKS